MNAIKILKAGIAVTVATVLTLSLIYPGKAAVLALILGGYIAAPEAAKITRHYAFGNGEDLYLASDYIRNSPVVLKNLDLKPGEVRKVALKQAEDWRLSYALNPFHIKRNGKGYTIFQYIDYGHGPNRNVISELNLGFTKIKVYDNIVHSFECKPFTVYIHFN